MLTFANLRIAFVLSSILYCTVLYCTILYYTVLQGLESMEFITNLISHDSAASSPAPASQPVTVDSAGGGGRGKQDTPQEEIAIQLDNITLAEE